MLNFFGIVIIGKIYFTFSSFQMAMHFVKNIEILNMDDVLI